MPLKLHGKEYMTVAERINLLLSQGEVTRFYSLNTDIVEINDAYCVIKATLTLGPNLSGCTSPNFTGHAMEEKGNKGVNKTSHVENCETSAIGRALAAAGFHGSEYASADELVEALNKQSDKFAVTTNSKPSEPEKISGVKASAKAAGFKGSYYDFLNQCSVEKATVGEAQYRSILSELGVSKANQIDKGNKVAQIDILKKLSTMKPVTDDMIFPLEVSYLCSTYGEEVERTVIDKDLDSFKTTVERRSFLDTIHIAIQSVVNKRSQAALQLNE